MNVFVHLLSSIILNGIRREISTLFTNNSNPTIKSRFSPSDTISELLKMTIFSGRRACAFLLHIEASCTICRVLHVACDDSKGTLTGDTE